MFVVHGYYKPIKIESSTKNLFMVNQPYNLILLSLFSFMFHLKYTFSCQAILTQIFYLKFAIEMGKVIKNEAAHVSYDI